MPRTIDLDHPVSGSKPQAIELCKMFSNGMIPYRKFLKITTNQTTLYGYVGRNHIHILAQENLQKTRIPITAWFGATLRRVFIMMLLTVMQ